MLLYLHLTLSHKIQFKSDGKNEAHTTSTYFSHEKC